MLAIVDSTLAARQSTALRTTGAAIALAVRQAYVQTDAAARRRWPRTGTSIGSARIIDGLADCLAATIIDQETTCTILFTRSSGCARPSPS
ncbi:hypothetical protein [Nonomuraea lactucae]|uniref:hypothetical protein n=1 Tax=Nonomuraea lactucae TaxID=2249762 RepID=UPI000DE51739|nr:hypothetical protein [Nonomuraea lactucae]